MRASTTHDMSKLTPRDSPRGPVASSLDAADDRGKGHRDDGTTRDDVQKGEGVEIGGWERQRGQRWCRKKSPAAVRSKRATRPRERDTNVLNSVLDMLGYIKLG